MPRPQLKFGDMEPIVLFDSVGARAVPNGPMNVTSQLSFNNPASSGIEAPGFSLFSMLDSGNGGGQQRLTLGKRLATAGLWEGPVTAGPGYVPVATSTTLNNKLYTVEVFGAGTLQVINLTTGAVINPALAAGVGVVQAVYGSKTGAYLLVAGGAGLAVIDTTTDIVTPIPGTAVSAWLSPYITENNSFIIAYNISTQEVHYFTLAGALLGSYPNPGGVASVFGRTHLLATNSAGTNAWFIYQVANNQFVVRFNPATGVVFGSTFAGATGGSPYVEMIYSEAFDRLLARVNVGTQLALFTASTLGLVGNVNNWPSFTSSNLCQSSLMLNPGGATVSLISDSQGDTAIRMVQIQGTLTFSGTGALSVLQVIAPPSQWMNYANNLNRIRGFVVAPDFSRVFYAPADLSGFLFSSGLYPNRVLTNTLTPLNYGTVFVEGSVAVAPLQSLYVDQIHPVGGSYLPNEPVIQPFGAVRIDRLAPASVLGNVTFGEGSTLYSETDYFLADVEMYGTYDYFGTQFQVNNGTAGFFNPFTEFSGAQLEINSQTDVNGLFRFFGAAQVKGSGSLVVENGASMAGLVGATFAWNGVAVFNGSPVSSLLGYKGPTILDPALFPVGMRINALGQEISTLAPATDLILNGVSGDVSSSSNFKTINDFECTTPSSLAGGAPADRGLVLKDNAGVRWRVTVSTLGALRVFLA